MSPSEFPFDPHLSDAITRAESRRAKLERLTELGMALAETIISRAAQAPEEVEPRREPERAFASVARAVGLTLALEARIDKDIIAMRKGKSWPLAAAAEIGASAPPAAWPEVEVAVPQPLCPRRARVRNAVWEAVNQEMRGLREATEVLDCLHESLIEREDYETLLDRPWREAVAVICSDLGLNPDWSRWSDEEGFVREFEDSGYFWQRHWRYSPERAEERRRRRDGRPAFLAREGGGAADG